MANLNGRLMNIKLKIGWDVADFAKYFACSEEEFLQLLQKNFTSKSYKDMVSRMESNSKRKTKAMKCIRNRKIKVPKTLKLEEIEILREATLEELLEEIKSEEAGIQKEICEKEKIREEILSRKRKIEDKLQDEKNIVLRLNQEIQLHQNNIETSITELNKIGIEFENINTQIEEAQGILAEIQAQIKDLETINIFAYANGEIEVDNTEINMPHDWENVFKDFTSNTLLEDLTVKQIKQLTKVVIIVDSFLKEGKNFEVTFEVEAVQLAYEQLISQVNPKEIAVA